MVNSLKEPLGEGVAGIVVSALDAVLVLDQEMRVAEWSEAAAALFGIDRREALGADLVELIVPAELRDSVRYCLAGGEGEPPEDEELLGRRIELPAQRADKKHEIALRQCRRPGWG